jgi:hypothetical protein
MYHLHGAIHLWQDDTVVFGHSLGEQDKHIIAALNKGAPREVAVSIYPRAEDQLIIQGEGPHHPVAW